MKFKHIKIITTLLVFYSLLFSEDAIKEWYEPLGLKLGTFATYDKDNLGHKGYFNELDIICPNHFDECKVKLAKMLKERVDAVTMSSMGLFVKMFAKSKFAEAKATVLKEIDNNIDAMYLDQYIVDIWGICYTNDDKLIVYIDNASNLIGWFDFGNPVDMSEKGTNLLSLNSFSKSGIDIDLNDVSIPKIDRFYFDLDESTGTVDKMDDPRGLCTDHNNNFWVADYNNNRVLRFVYSKEDGMTHMGTLNGLNLPQDVSIINSGTYSTLLGVANVGDNNLCFVDPYFTGTTDFKSMSSTEKVTVSSIFVDGDEKSILIPKSITSSANDNVEFVFDKNKVASISRSGEFTFNNYGDYSEWPLDADLSCIKGDNIGNVFVLDNTNAYLGKYNKNLELIFISGGQSDQDITNMALLKFNNPRYIAVGEKIDNFIITEKLQKFNGIKRFT